MTGIVVTTFFYGALPLLGVTLLQALFENLLGLNKLLEKERCENKGATLYIMQFASDLLFFVVLPALAYFWLYPVMPFAGFRAGVAIGIGAYMLGSLPYALNLSQRVKIPPALILSTLFFNLLKLVAALGAITHYIKY